MRDTCARLGMGFDGWQDGAGRLILAKRRDGLYAADQIVVSIPRQVGKTYLFGAIVFALCLLFPGLTVIWTAHRVKTAKETFNSMAGMAAKEEVAAHIQQVIRGRGDEAILFNNGSRILFGAREAGFGRGFTDVDVLMFDEAQILTESAMEDMIASQNVAANPLTILTGTPPRPRDPGEVFTLARQDAIDGDTEETVYIELSADRGCDLTDRDQWRKANPSFPSRTSARAMLRMKKNLSEESFLREALGVWDEVSRHQAVVKASLWKSLESLGPDDGVKPRALAVDMSHNGQIAVAGCWADGERLHGEMVWKGTHLETATDWVVQRARPRIPVVIDNASPAAAMIPTLRARKVRVIESTAGDMSKACQQFVSKVFGSLLSHDGDESLAAAIEGARKRAIRDAGGWGWDRRDDTVNIAPLVALTLALFGASTTRQTSGRRSSSRGREAVVM